MDSRARTSGTGYRNLPHQDRITTRYIIRRERILNSSDPIDDYPESPDSTEESHIWRTGIPVVTLCFPAKINPDLVASGTPRNYTTRVESWFLARSSLFLSRLIKSHYQNNGMVPNTDMCIVLPIPHSTMRHMLNLFYNNYAVLKQEEMANFWQAAEYLEIHQTESNYQFCYPVETQLFSERYRRYVRKSQVTYSFNSASWPNNSACMHHPPCVPMEEDEIAEEENPPDSEENDANVADGTENENVNHRETPPSIPALPRRTVSLDRPHFSGNRAEAIGNDGENEDTSNEEKAVPNNKREHESDDEEDL